ncbi:glycerol-3-phosphate 1-O-acyltransferase PlsY [Cohnella lubricantis]|uniref:Glycerol-3-phosphate acyltransferase n=1 Tax=Cohnella lubricantis TaxID=2163172 RepID=A0A841TH08_9BACL|nr:glycerol-3-phosphate 1-O-acyltransferase PlsY [Cohnella lubricantis]MBB6677731.1 glycerol-3-phosphate 1-O-acyltransferase PlsY [Cohnella lubricantis]MBP2117693.1 glycerol-3-phosphate acyltransferase PlsY [Cohnella lubricantis]
MTLAIIAIAASYLLGSVSFSIIIARLMGKIDIRQHGSGNAGATNTLRVLGKGPGIAVFLLDIVKGVIAVTLGYLLNGDEYVWLPVLCGLAAIIGHNWPIYFRFKGGKGIATTVGAMVTLAPLAVVIAGVVAILLIVFTRYVSLGSIVFTVLLPIILAIGGWPASYIWGGVVVAVLAIVRHRKNIVKLLNGTENKLGSGKKGEPHGV